LETVKHHFQHHISGQKSQLTSSLRRTILLLVLTTLGSAASLCTTFSGSSIVSTASFSSSSTATAYIRQSIVSKIPKSEKTQRKFLTQQIFN